MEEKTRLAEALADRYRIEREIGSGGMATVYLAEDLKHNRQVALKGHCQLKATRSVRRRSATEDVSVFRQP